MSDLTVTIYNNGVIVETAQVNSMQDALDFFLDEINEKHYKFTVIVTDSSNNEHGRFYFPYERVYINSAMSNPLKHIQEDYDIPKEEFEKWVLAWIANNE